MLYTKCKNIICVGAIWALSPLVYAVTRAPTGFGAVANNMIEPVNVLSDFVATASFIIGTMMVFSSFLRYLRYRQNPLAAPLSSVVTLLVIGLALLCLPLIYMLTESGIPYMTH